MSEGMQRGLEKLDKLVIGTVQKKAAAAAERLLPVNLHLKKKTSIGAGVNKTMPDFRH